MASEHGPAATTRHVLLTLSLYMDRAGSGAYPSMGTLSVATGLSERSLYPHIDAAEAEGWIVRTRRKWKPASYTATLPENLKNLPILAEDGTEATSVSGGGETEATSDSHKRETEATSCDKRKQLHPISSVNRTTHSLSLFDEAWEAYPRRPNNSKTAARKAWDARLKAGEDPHLMLEGARRYAAYVAAEGTAPRYVKQAKTFFGPDEWYKTDFGAPNGDGTAPDLSSLWDPDTMGAFR